jgi:hypothetical protein
VFIKFILLCCLLIPTLHAGEFHIIARAGLDNYSLPYRSSLSNTNPSLNDSTQTLFRYWGYNDRSMETEQRLWLSTNDDGKTIYTAPDGWLITDPKFYGSQTIIFSLSDFRQTGGLWRLDLGHEHVPSLSLILDPKKVPFLEAISSPALLAPETYIFRGMDKEGRRHLMQIHGDEIATLISEDSLFQDQLVTYVFSPFVRSDVLAVKVSFNEIDQMLVYQSGEWRLAAQTGPDLKSIQNNGSINAKADIAFIGVDLNGEQQIFRTQNSQLISSASFQGRELVSHFETFAPSLNDLGVVAFRALDERGYRSLFLWSQSRIQKLISEGDEIPLENGGTGRVFLGAWGPGFAGAPSLNNRGEISFAVTLMEKHTPLRLGSALYLFRPHLVLP